MNGSFLTTEPTRNLQKRRNSALYLMQLQNLKKNHSITPCKRDQSTRRFSLSLQKDQSGWEQTSRRCSVGFDSLRLTRDTIDSSWLSQQQEKWKFGDAACLFVAIAMTAEEYGFSLARSKNGKGSSDWQYRSEEDFGLTVLVFGTGCEQRHRIINPSWVTELDRSKRSSSRESGDLCRAHKIERTGQLDLQSQVN